MGYYKSMRDHVAALEANGKLFRVKRTVNKDTELMPLVKLEFRGLPEQERKAFLFENVTDTKGKKYNSSVLIGAHGASRQIHAMASMCPQAEIKERWVQALLHPLQPKIVKAGPVQEEIHVGSKLLEHGGLEEFPIPISTPGFDNAPYLTAPCWVSKDIDTGITNVGTYRGMVKSKTRVGCNSAAPKHLGMHLEKYRARGKSMMPAAIVLGATPVVGLTSVVKVPYGVNEYTIASAVAGEPIELVKCQTVDLEVPATAEIVIEGEIPVDFVEREAPFGEYTGYMGMDTGSPVLEVKCITHRKNPIYVAHTSQFPPSESSIIRGHGYEINFYKFIKYELSIPNLQDVVFHEESGSSLTCILSLKEGTPQMLVWKALHGAAAYDPLVAKIIIAVDGDVDPYDADSVFWALSFRMQPHQDIQIVGGMSATLDPSAAPASDRKVEQRTPTSTMMINATRKWAYPPLSLPPRQFMEHAIKLWEEEGLPKLNLRTPWFGRSLGFWTKENEAEAELALKGEYYQTGEKLARDRTNLK